MLSVSVVSRNGFARIVHPHLSLGLRADRILGLGITVQLAEKVCLDLKGIYVQRKAVKFICCLE